METLAYSCAGCLITLHISRRAKRNIILRPRDPSSLHISIPPWFTQTQLHDWLARNETMLQKMLQKAACTPQPPQHLPDWIWLHGQITPLIVSPNIAHIALHQSSLHLPNAQREPLQQWLWQQAERILLPKLAQHAAQHRLRPAALKLSHAKTFWGVCRARTGIRLNWRLIGAPEAVQDYVCLHELAHLTHANHSPAFWQLLAHYCPHTPSAEQWLKQHGNELFLLG